MSSGRSRDRSVSRPEPGLHDPGASADHRGRSGIDLGFWLALLALLPIAATAALSWRRFFQLDEFVFVRCAWLVSLGQMPYRDFFDHHTPLFYLMLSPFIGAAPETVAALHVGRLVALVLLTAIVTLVWRLGRRLADREGAWFSVLLLLTTFGFVARAIEIRPDLLATLCFLAAGWLLVESPRPPAWRSALAGALLAAALLSTQKSLYYLWGFGVLWLLDAWQAARGRRDRGADRRFTGNPIAFASGVVGPLIAFAALLWANGALAAFWQQNVELALAWQQTDSTFPFGRFLVPMLVASPHWFLLTVAGTVALAFDPQLKRGLDPRSVAIYLALLLPAMLSLALNPSPWPYNFLPLFAAATPLVAVVPRALRLRRPRLGTAVTLFLVVLALTIFGRQMAGELRRDNQQQKADLATILNLAEPGTTVYDNNGGYLFRPAATNYWYHSNAMRNLLYDELARTMAPEILRSEAPVWIHDLRFQELPPGVQRFVLGSYQRYHRAIFLWGSAYHFGGTASEVTAAGFRAIRSGSYFVRPRRDSGPPPEVLVDGQPVPILEPFRLEAGRHEVAVELPGNGRPVDFFILWLPPDGELWQPLPGRPPPHYPYLF